MSMELNNKIGERKCDVEGEFWLKERQERLQHDLNCLEHPNRAKRRRALKDIAQKLNDLTLLDHRREHSELSEKFLSQTLLQPLSARIADDSDACRETALDILLQIALSSSESICDEMMSCTLPHISQRLLGSEPAEEIRLLALQLLQTLIQRGSQGFKNHIEEIISFLLKSIQDPFPELKIASSDVVLILSELGAGVRTRDESDGDRLNMLEPYADALAKALLTNLKHQRSRVRVQTLKAITILMRSTATEFSFPDWAEQLLATLCGVVMLSDRASSVREELCEQSALMLQQLPGLKESQSAPLLLSMLLNLSDPLPQLQQHAQQTLTSLANSLYQTSDKKVAEDVDEDVCQRLVARDLEWLLNWSFKELNGWVSESRRAGARLLNALLTKAAQAVQPFADRILLALVKAVSDEDQEVSSNVLSCCRIIGANVSVDIIIDVLLSTLFDRSGAERSAFFQGSILRVLHNSLSYLGPSGDKSPLLRLAPILEEPTFCMSEDAIVRSECVALVEALLKHVSVLDKFKFELFWALLQLQAATPPEHDLLPKISAVSASLAALVYSSGGAEQLFADHLSSAMARITSSAAPTSWTAVEPRLRLFLSLLSTAKTSPVLARHLAIVLPVVESCANRSANVEVRVLVLGVLSTVLFSVSSGSAEQELFSNWARFLLHKILLPNLVWKIGRQQAMARHYAIEAVLAVLSNGLVRSETIVELSKELLPQLLSSLDDFDIPVRLNAAKCFPSVLPHLPPIADEEELRQLYGELLKRLDDSEDEIRIECCSSLASFVGHCLKRDQHAPEHYERIVRSSLVHLDDPNHAVQSAVLELLHQVSGFDAAVFASEVGEAAKKHSNPRLCLSLLD